MNHRFNVIAAEDPNAAVEYYNAAQRGLGNDFAVAVGIGIAAILEAPARWPEDTPGFRKYRA